MKRSRSCSTLRPSDEEAIEATAAAWLAQRDDSFTPENEAEFVQWRALDPRHEAAVARLEATWSALQQLRDFRPEAAMHPDRNLLARPQSLRRASRFPVIATAALAASLAFAALWWFTVPRFERAPQAFATTVDGYERVTLEDGSVLELNSNSEVSVRFTATERRVRLVRGEAHFNVAKSRARPFSVDAGAVAVRAVGTAFNVRLGEGDVEVLVTEGRVEVDQVVDRGVSNVLMDSRDENARSSPRASPSIASLGANERVLISTAGFIHAPPVEKIPPEAVREALAWQGPRLIFLDTPLAQAIEQFNRRNQVQLELGDAELMTMPIGGSFRAENVEAFVRLLTSGDDITAERPDAGRIVLRKGK